GRAAHGTRPGDVQPTPPPLPGRLPVHVVDARPRPRVPAQLRSRLDQTPRHLGGVANDPGVDVADERKELGLGEAVVLVHAEPGRLAEDRDGALGEWITDENLN